MTTLAQNQLLECLEVDAEAQWRFYLSGLRNFLENRITGQAVACQRIARAVQAAELGLNEGGQRPKCSFLFLGPTGVGKTESAKCFTEFVFGSKAALEMVFMNEYTSDLRFEEFLQRTEVAILRHPDGTTLLFDEVEKADPEVFGLRLYVEHENLTARETYRRLGMTQTGYLLMEKGPL